MSREQGPSHRPESVARLLVCPNAFKGSLTALQAARAIRDGIERAIAAPAPVLTGETGAGRVQIILLPLADGGDGTLETLVEGTGGTLYRERVSGPLGAPVEAWWGRLGGTQRDTAVIEMAQASGLRLLRPGEADPRRASTYGTGQLMLSAASAGCRTLIVGIGGSATNDGGAGMAQALGARLLDAAGRDLPPGGAALRNLARIDTRGWLLPPDVHVLVACDVDNPLCGPEGAAAVYGPQKGASREMVEELDAALAHYAAILRAQRDADVAALPGAGAAGGLGAGLIAFCGARLRPGVEMVFEVTDFDARLRQCGLVFTGEGRLDAQTARGKVIAGVGRRALRAGVPVVALAGALSDEAEALLRPLGVTAAFSIADGPLTVEEAMRDAYRLLAAAAERVWRLLALRLP
jgi:glycerate kinase